MQETIARVPAPERIVHVARDERRRAPRDTAPVGIIFHVARCGSTLISQSLKQLDDLVVYAEPQPVNEILAPPHKWPRADLVAALAHARRRLCPPRARTVRPEAEQLEHALLRHRGRSLSGDALGPEPARPGRGRRVAARAARPDGSRARRRPLAGSSRRWIRDTPRSRAKSSSRVPMGPSARRPRDSMSSAGGWCRTNPCPRQCGDVVAPHFSLSIDPAQRDRIAAGGAAACKGAGRNGRGVHFRRRRQAGRCIARAASGDRLARAPATGAAHAIARGYNAAVNTSTVGTFEPRCSPPSRKRRARTSPGRSTSSRRRSRGTASTRHCSSSARRS